MTVRGSCHCSAVRIEAPRASGRGFIEGRESLMLERTFCA